MTQKNELLEALKLLLSYTKACEGVLNCKPAGQIGIAERAIAKAEAVPINEIEQLKLRIRIHLANRDYYSHKEFCEKLEQILYEVAPPAVSELESCVTYAHKDDATGKTRYRQLAKDPVPAWAVDVQPDTAPPAAVPLTDEQIDAAWKELILATQTTNPHTVFKRGVRFAEKHQNIRSK